MRPWIATKSPSPTISPGSWQTSSDNCSTSTFNAARPRGPALKDDTGPKHHRGFEEAAPRPDVVIGLQRAFVAAKRIE
jgi:hypothetical protein